MSVFLFTKIGLTALVLFVVMMNVDECEDPRMPLWVAVIGMSAIVVMILSAIGIIWTAIP